MSTVFFYFYEELNDFFQYELFDIPIEVDFNSHETVKHIIETLGVPHTEVGVIIINGNSVGFDHKPNPDDIIYVYPSVDDVEVRPVINLQPKPMEEFRFVLDGHLGKLAGYLRLLGFDTLYQNDYDDAELAKISSLERRMLLTRDRGLLKRAEVVYGYFVREKSPRKQLSEVVNRFDLKELAKPFHRCSNCNGLLVRVDKGNIIDRLAPKTKLYYEDFRICDKCDQIYWKGSHFEKMEYFFSSILNGNHNLEDEKSREI
jgi:uncharacterized protein with PIN domain